MFNDVVKIAKAISTHTLTWSVTQFVKTTINIQHISTHTLTWSVTKETNKKSRELEFQLTRSRGA